MAEDTGREVRYYRSLEGECPGWDGLFLEVHPDPRSAPSDSSSMLPLDELKPLLERVVAIRTALAEVDLEPSVSTG